MQRLHHTVEFSETCWYPTTDANRHWNKGMGFTYSLFNDKNSIRWAWRPTPTKDGIEVCIYIHLNGYTYTSGHISVPTESEINLTLTYSTRLNKAELILNNDFTSKVVRQEFLQMIPKRGYVNRPYFGGTPTAPHDMTIKIQL